MSVADASVVVDLLLNPGSPAGGALARRFADDEQISAPHLMDVEVGQTLRRFALRGVISADRADALLDILAALPIRRFAHANLLQRAFALRANVTMYDGIYLALAEMLDVPLLTGDAALADVPGCTATVEILAAGAAG